VIKTAPAAPIGTGDNYDTNNMRKHWKEEQVSAEAPQGATKAYVEFSCKIASIGLDNLVIYSNDKTFTQIVNSNAHTLDWNGNAWFAGDITVGKDSKKIALEEDVDTRLSFEKHQTLLPYQKEILRANVGYDELCDELQPPIIYTSTTDDKTILTIEHPSKPAIGLEVVEIPHGKVPVKGVDYFTDSEIAAIVKDIPGKRTDSGEVFNDYTGNSATGSFSHASGHMTAAAGEASHAEGYSTEVDAKGGHVEGYAAKVFNDSASVSVYASETFGGHAEGHQSEASSRAAHAEGCFTRATNEGSHAEGYRSEATGAFAHAEGDKGIANGQGAHAEGYHTIARDLASHAEGKGTIAAGVGQHAGGRYNVEDSTKLVVIGNGSSNSSRSNAYTLDTDGNGWFAGDITLGAKNRPIRATFSGTYDPNTLDIGNDGDIYIRYTN
jgi:hypothetical protein